MRSLLRDGPDTSLKAAAEPMDAPVFLGLVLALFAFFFALSQDEARRRQAAEEAFAGEAAPLIAVLRAAPEGPRSAPLTALFSEALEAAAADLIPGEALPPGVHAAARFPTTELFIGRTSALDPDAAERLRRLKHVLPDLVSRLGGGARVILRVEPEYAGDKVLALRRAEALAAHLGTDAGATLRYGAAGAAGPFTSILLEGGARDVGD